MLPRAGCWRTVSGLAGLVPRPNALAARAREEASGQQAGPGPRGSRVGLVAAELRADGACRTPSPFLPLPRGIFFFFNIDVRDRDKWRRELPPSASLPSGQPGSWAAGAPLPESSLPLPGPCCWKPGVSGQG